MTLLRLQSALTYRLQCLLLAARFCVCVRLCCGAAIEIQGLFNIENKAALLLLEKLQGRGAFIYATLLLRAQKFTAAAVFSHI